MRHCMKDIDWKRLQNKKHKSINRLYKEELEWELDSNHYYKLKHTVSLKFGNTEGLCKTGSQYSCQLNK